MSKMEKWFIYIFVFLNSISGLQIAGRSLNTVFVGLFFVYTLISFIKHRRGKLISIKAKDPLVWYLVAALLSSVFSCFYEYVLPHTSIVISYSINCIAYLYMYITLSNCKNDFKKSIVDTFIEALVYAARIQAAWGIAQIILLYSFGININQLLFVDILHSSNSRDWIMGFFTGSSWNMRITGLNYENSNFAMAVCIGMTLEKKPIWKLVLIATAILSLSRTGWIMVAGYIFILAVRRFNKANLRINKKAFFRDIAVAIFAVVAVIVLYTKSYAIRRQINNIFLRLGDSSAINISAIRHLMYYPYGFYLWLFDANIIHKLIGYGMRCSGIAFSQNAAVASAIGITEHFDSAWAVECDVIGLLLGGGIFALITYYWAFAKCIKQRDNPLRDALIVLLMGGLTYHFHSISYLVFVVIFASIYSNTKELKKEAVFSQ